MRVELVIMVDLAVEVLVLLVQIQQVLLEQMEVLD
jgi:hypothetical protein